MNEYEARLFPDAVPYNERYKLIDHGTRARYRAGPGCRCSDCVAANRFYNKIASRRYKQKMKEQGEFVQSPVKHDDAIDTLLEILHG